MDSLIYIKKANMCPSSLVNASHGGPLYKED